MDCDGDLCWVEVEPGETITGTITVENIGDDGSLLDWEIESYPEWGTWTFIPDGGTGVKPEYGFITVDVELIAPNDLSEEYYSEVLIVNLDNPGNHCVIDAWIQESIDDNTPIVHYFFFPTTKNFHSFLFPSFSTMINLASVKNCST